MGRYHPSTNELDLDAMAHEKSCSERRTLRWAIGDLVAPKSPSAMDEPSILSPENLRRAKWMLANSRYDLPNWLRPDCHRHKPEHRYKSMYGRLDWRLPAHTITSGFLSPGQGRYLHPTRLRTLTPHEAARLQFFPDWYQFSAITKRCVLAEAIANAVPPKLTFGVVAYLLRREEADCRACAAE